MLCYATQDNDDEEGVEFEVKNEDERERNELCSFRCVRPILSFRSFCQSTPPTQHNPLATFLFFREADAGHLVVFHGVCMRIANESTVQKLFTRQQDNSVGVVVAFLCENSRIFVIFNSIIH